MKISLIAILSGAIIFTGCSHKNPEYLKPNLQHNLENRIIPVPVNIYDKTFDINSSQTLSDITNKMTNIVKVGNKDIFNKKIGINLKQITLKDLMKYYKEVYNYRISIKNRGNIYFLEAFNPEKRHAKCNQTISIDGLKLEGAIEMMNVANSQCNFVFYNTYEGLEAVASQRVDENGTLIVSQAHTKSIYDTPIYFDGDTKQLMKRIENQFNLIVEEDTNTYTFRNNTSKTIKLNISDVSLKNDNLKISENNPYTQLENAIKAQYPALKININKSAGLLHLTGDSREIRDVERSIVKKYNEIFSKTIMVNMDILTISKDNLDERGIDINALLSNAINMSSGLKLNSMGLGEVGTWSGAVSTSSNMIDNQGNGLFTFSTKNGSSAVINFLKKTSDTEIVQSPKLRVTNTVPSRFEILETYEYVKKFDESSTLSNTTNINTDNSNTINAVTREPITEKAEEGITFDVQASIEKDDKIKLILRPVIKKVLGFDTIKYAGVNDIENEIKLPHLQKYDFSQTLNLQENETAVIGGMRITKYDRTFAGLPESETLTPLQLLDNSQIVGKDMYIVLVVTARVVN